MATPFTPEVGKKTRQPVKPVTDTIDSVTNMPPIGTAIRVEAGPHSITGLVYDDGSYGVVTLCIPTNGFYSHAFNAAVKYGDWTFTVLDDDEREEFLSFLEPKFREALDDDIRSKAARN